MMPMLQPCGKMVLFLTNSVGVVASRWLVAAFLSDLLIAYDSLYQTAPMVFIRYTQVVGKKLG